MSTNSITLKHNKHRVHPCPNDKKIELLHVLIAQNSEAEIFVLSTNSIELLKESINEDRVSIIDDSNLAKNSDLVCDILISYDLPSSADDYMSRLSRVKDTALILLDSSEQKQLYPIETLLKRVIKQDIIKGFEYKDEQKIKVAQRPVQKPKREYAFKTDGDERPKYNKPKRDGEKSERKPFDKPKYNKPKRDGEKSERKPFDKPKYDKPKRDGEKSERKPFDKPKYDKPKRDGEKSERKPNKFLGKDENGKAIFSGKSGDRNHRHDGTQKDKYEAPKKVGRKISIKERKPKAKEDSNS